MIENTLPLIRKIFIGRHLELRRLRGLWDLACQDEEHLVYVLLNAPGVGKTTLINHFGNMLEAEGKGLSIKFVCDSGYNSPEKINKEILNAVQKAIKKRIQTLDKHWMLKGENLDLEEEKEDFQYLKKNLRDILKQPELDLYNVYDILNRLSIIIPLFFAADEIQEFQKTSFKIPLNKEDEKEDGEKETALHYFTRILKALINSRILIILSGTRYHILSQIGGNIGSPIRQKVTPIIVRNFETEEIFAYVEQVRILIEEEGVKQEIENISNQLENYRQFLFAFSGGHPRTIANITDLFLNHLSFLTSNSQYQNYDAFMDFILPKVEEFFSNTLLSSIHKKALSNLTASEGFSEIKNWILNYGSRGQALGQRPTLTNNSLLDDEMKRITYELMNIGIMVQNGSYNYHLTSYFHFLEFLKIYDEPYEKFLKQVLHNKYFKLMCGRHSGLGYTFENIFMSTLIIHENKDKKEVFIPLQSSRLRTLKVLRGKLKWSELPLELNILYHTPEAKAVDAYVLQENELLLIQITTANPPDSSKIDVLLSEIETILNIRLKIGKKHKIRGWLVSLFDFKCELPSNENLFITAGDQLIPLLGERLYMKLKEVKISFSKIAM